MTDNEKLLKACRNGWGDSAVKCLLAGADANYMNGKGHTPLHLATIQGSAFIVINLITAGARLEDKILLAGKTALHLAVQRDQEQMAKLLILMGADPDARQAPPFRAGKDSADAAGILAFSRFLDWRLLLFDILLDDADWRTATRRGKV